MSFLPRLRRFQVRVISDHEFDVIYYDDLHGQILASPKSYNDYNIAFDLSDDYEANGVPNNDFSNWILVALN